MMEMTHERYEKLREVFNAVCDLPAGRRGVAIAERCGGDHELAENVRSLLALDAKRTGILDSPEMTEEMRRRLHDTLVEQETRTVLPDHIGRYRIIRRIGDGGMGTIYEAEQDQPRRTVALKVIRPGLAGESLLRRFEHEAHVLGLLQHPGIAQIYDAGTADAGRGAQPYFAMELVRGEPLPAYARGRRLDVRQRLDLVARICDAIQHAHAKGVVHRDLKPGNILVTRDGQPKILDFGIARATDADVKTTTLHTGIGQLVGTIPYMSPEQAAGDADDIDTRSDVYSLGVVLYELLTDRLPYELERKLVHEAVRIIREEEPTRLSTISRVFRGDIETIVAKALEKDRDLRYQTASDLAADVRRYLNDEPIVAVRPTTMYQLRKFAKRHRPLVASVCGLFLTLVLATAVSTWAMSRAVRARHAQVELTAAAQEAALMHEQTADFLRRILMGIDPDVAQEHDTALLRMILADARERTEPPSDVDPLVAALVLDAIGVAYAQLGEWEPAFECLSKALMIRSEHLDEDNFQLSESLCHLGLYSLGVGQLDEASEYLERCAAIRRRTLEPEHPERLLADVRLALLYREQARLRDAEELLRSVLKVQRMQDDANILLTLNNLADVCMALDQFEEAETLLKESLEGRRARFGSHHLDTMVTQNNLGLLYSRIGRYDEAQPMIEEALEIRRRVLGKDHPSTLTTQNNLGLLYDNMGLDREAEAIYRDVLQARDRVLGPDHPNSLTAASNLAGLLRKLGRYDEAEPYTVRVAEGRARALGPLHPKTVGARSRLATLYYEHFDRSEEAETILVTTFEDSLRELGETHRCTVRTAEYLADYYEAAGEPEKAEPYRQLVAAQNSAQQ